MSKGVHFVAEVLYRPHQESTRPHILDEITHTNYYLYESIS